MRDLVNKLGKAILEELKPHGRKVWELFVNAISSLKAGISYDISGTPSWSISLGDITNPTISLDEIFNYLQKADRPCLVAIDEFQQIGKYDEDTIEATLRTYVQYCSNAHFIFAGSQRHLMGSIFTSPSRPFYQSVTIMNLPPIPKDKYRELLSDISGKIIKYCVRKWLIYCMIVLPVERFICESDECTFLENS